MRDTRSRSCIPASTNMITESLRYIETQCKRADHYWSAFDDELMPPRRKPSSNRTHHSQVLVLLHVRRKARIVPKVPSTLVAPQRRRSQLPPRLRRVLSRCVFKPCSPVALFVVIHTLALFFRPLCRLRRTRNVAVHCGHCGVAQSGGRLALVVAMPNPRHLEQTKYGVQQRCIS